MAERKLIRIHEVSHHAEELAFRRLLTPLVYMHIETAKQARPSASLS